MAKQEGFSVEVVKASMVAIGVSGNRADYFLTLRGPAVCADAISRIDNPDSIEHMDSYFNAVLQKTPDAPKKSHGPTANMKGQRSREAMERLAYRSKLGEVLDESLFKSDSETTIKEVMAGIRVMAITETEVQLRMTETVVTANHRRVEDWIREHFEPILSGKVYQRTVQFTWA